MLEVLDLFKENCFDEKLNSILNYSSCFIVVVFFELADDDGRGYINEEKLVRLFRKNLRTEEELKFVRPAGNINMYKCLYHCSSKMYGRKRDEIRRYKDHNKVKLE